MSETKDIIAKKMATQLGLQLGEPEVADELPAPKSGGIKIVRTPDNTKRKTPYTPKPLSTPEQYRKVAPESQTPSVYTKFKVDKSLLALQDKVVFEDPNVGRYSKEDWEKIVFDISRYLADVCEGAGFIYKHSEQMLGLRRMIDRELRTRFRVRIGEAYCDIKVEGDLDETNNK